MSRPRKRPAANPDEDEEPVGPSAKKAKKEKKARVSRSKKAPELKKDPKPKKEPKPKKPKKAKKQGRGRPRTGSSYGRERARTRRHTKGESHVPVWTHSIHSQAIHLPCNQKRTPPR